MNDPISAPSSMQTGSMPNSRRALLAAGFAAGMTFRPGVAGWAGRAIPLASVGSPGPALGDTPAARGEWDYFKSQFMRADGRVVDNANGGISHSEGQGFAMLLAVRFDEADVFARCLQWTRGMLARPDDTLLAWSYRPHEPNPVPDRNNATDGDLLVAWALAEAARKWHAPAYHALAVAMSRDILRHLVVEASDRVVLLPGIHGFRQNDGVVLNPSYYVFPAFQELRQILPAPQWSMLEEGGLRLMRNARFGRWGLVPDWVTLPRGSGRPSLAHGRPARFSYDAMRVPLYLVWGGFASEPAVGAAAQFWHDPEHRHMPAWVDLRTNQPAHYAADPGIAAIAALSDSGGGRPVQRLKATPPVLPHAYYATVLRLLARQADIERGT